MTRLLNSPLAGMVDLFGPQLRRRLYVQTTLADLARRHGYDEVAVPLVERASSFSEDVVGRSPWPEWDQRGCFYLRVPDYVSSYDDEPAQVDALLIPEGTISVTRWLGSVLAAEPDFVFPLKLYYQTPCFRNELVSSLETGKARSFTQFGLEVLGTEPGTSDVEVIHLIAQCLIGLGVPSSAVRVRVGDVAVFNRLAQLSGIDADTAIALKELLDALAECRAGKAIHRRPGLLADLQTRLGVSAVDERWRKVWIDLASARDTVAVLAALDDAFIAERLRGLEDLGSAQREIGAQIEIDLCVVRSHEYYTGIAFEIDVNFQGMAFVEVGGGGRYDRLVGHFLPGSGGRTVPSTGFAFGVERVVGMLDQLGLLDEDRRAATAIGLKQATADELLVPAPGVAGYCDAVSLAESVRCEGQRVDIYLGAADGHGAYAKARGIAVTRIYSD